MTPATNLFDVPIGTRVQDPMLVRQVELCTGESGPFTVLTLGNRSGSLPSSPFWVRDQPQIAGITKGNVVQVIGEVTSYRDRRQLAVSSIRVLPTESVEWQQLVPSAGDPDPYWETIDRWRSEIRPLRLREATDAFFADADFREAFQQCPADLTGPHAILGGLLKHTVEVAAIARVLGRVFGADGSLVLAGALLHDIGKTESYDWNRGFEPTLAGQRLGSDNLGTVMLERRLHAVAPPMLSEAELQELQHIIVVAGSERLSGGGVEPRHLPAMVVRMANDGSVRGAAWAEGLQDLDSHELYGPELPRE